MAESSMELEREASPLTKKKWKKKKGLERKKKRE